MKIHAGKWPKYGIQNGMAATSVDCVTLIVALAGLCAQCVNEMVGELPNRDILKANTHRHTQTITSFQKGSPFRGRWGSRLLKSSFWVSRAPLCVIWQSLLLTACPLLIPLSQQRHLTKESSVKYLGKIEQFSPWVR